VFINYTLTKTVPITLNLRTRWSAAVVRITPRPLQPRGNDRRGWVGPDIRSGNFGKQKFLEICALLRYYTASGGDSLPTFRDHPSVLEDGTEFVPKCRLGITTLRCVISQKTANLIYFAAEAWYHTETSLIPVWKWKRTSDPHHIQYRDYALPK
jgi:hypothetical protein